MRVYLLIVLLLAPQLAHAMAQVIQAVGLALTYGAAAWSGWAIVGWALLVVGGVYGAEQQRKAAAAQAQAARAAYNNGLQDRTVTRVATDSPYVYVYGRARVGSAVVAMFSSGASDQYKHLVCIHAAHECDAIEEIYINGIALGTLDANGDVTGGNYYLAAPVSVSGEAHTGTTFTLAHVPIIRSLRITYWGYSRGKHVLLAIGCTLSGATVTLAAAPLGVTTFICNYDYQGGTSHVRVQKHLGTATDPADATLLAECPGLWSDTSVLRGLCYTVVRLDLHQAEFQGGLPSVEVLLRGKKLYDLRDGTTSWSQNPALAIYDYLTSEMCGVEASDLPSADYIAAANVCAPLPGATYSQSGTTVTVTLAAHGLAVNDVREMQISSGLAVSGHYQIASVPDANTFTYSAGSSLTTSGVLTIGGLYTINGTVTADQDQSKTLESLAQAMAGFIVATTWSIVAGKYVAPVVALDQSDIVGALSVTPGTSDANLYNGVKGQYTGAETSYVATDFPPYQNPAYVTGDGRELWTNISFPFTDSAQRVRNLCTIFVEDQRNGYTVTASFSMKVWALPIGTRVTFTSTFLGQAGKVYRITDKKYSPNSAVELSLKEDAATIWDFASTATLDDTPNTNLPNPFTVGVCGDVQMAETLYQTTGSAGVRSKATLSWTAPADATVIEYEVEYKAYVSGDWLELNNVRGTFYDFLDLAPDTYDFRVKARNVLNVVGPYTDVMTFTVYGLTAAPSPVMNFSVAAMAGMALASWDKTVDLDVLIGGKTVIRFCPLLIGATWEQSTVLQEFTGDAVTGLLPLKTGTYYAKFVDSTGHYSDTEASFVATEALVTGWTLTATTTQNPMFAGAKTDVAALNSNLQLDSVETIGAQLGLISTWGKIASLGGVQPSGEYAFDATLDLGTKAARRFHASLQSIAYDVGDTISLRGNVSTWTSVSGAAVNDCDAGVLASVSDDNITYGPWTPFMVADFNCRYAQFKAQLSSGLSTHNIQVSQLSVDVKTPV